MWPGTPAILLFDILQYSTASSAQDPAPPTEDIDKMPTAFDRRHMKIGVIGLGYVGLPLAVAFGGHYPTVGFDIDASRIAELKQRNDRSLEVEPAELEAATGLSYTQSPQDIADCNLFVVTVPTPVNAHKEPDFGPLTSASRMLGALLKPGDIVVYESTVYPGATEEVCVPILEEVSGLKLNLGFFVGYSPERINPGDKAHRLSNIKKVTAGSTREVADLIDALYRSIVTAGTHRASSIRVAEAAKVIENTQRDVNIALINELAVIFNRLGIDTQEVLAAAGSKWNFLPFKPGLVGGHCIGVDPYYLTHKAQAIGYHPEIILAGRRLNDSMGAYVAGRVIKLLLQRHRVSRDTRVLILGLTFKENCPDLRNTRVIDIIEELGDYGISCEVYDPWVDPAEAQRAYGFAPIAEPTEGRYDAVILAVAHRQFAELGVERIRAFGKTGAILYDIKHLFPAEAVDGRL
jgi:UDP-N-acetyl-D-galactosamine dehydrogenase